MLAPKLSRPINWAAFHASGTIVPPPREPSINWPGVAVLMITIGAVCMWVGWLGR